VVLALPGRDDTAADFFDGLAAGKPVIFLGDGWQRSLLESRGAGFGVGLADPAAAREIADILRNPDGLRRAGQQAAALAAGRFALDRLAGELRATIEAMAAAAPRRETIRRRTLIAKRIFDVAVAGATLVALSPAILVFALLAAIKLGWPPIVAQSRIGLRGHTFRLFKFRTLTEAEDPSGALLPEAERATPFGRFLRRTALDELPTLLNVIAGDMSLVGPRAHPADYAAFYTPAQRRRHEVRPGLTGWAQVDDSPDRTWEQRFARDLEYVDRLSLGLDARILARTALILLRGRRLAPAGQPPIPRFDEIMARREGAEDA
jgi:lipopolysaccharide/colanic/teichoic acid biosynthesis glycosyltransferase